MTVSQLPVRYVLNEREYDLLKRYISRTSRRGDDNKEAESPTQRDDHKAAAFRSAARVFVLTLGSLKAIDLVLSRLSARKSQTATRSRKPLLASNTKIALSLSSLLFLHATLFRIFARL